MSARPRTGRERRKSTPKREAFEVVLIVCEGTKTEPAYFKGLCNELRLSSANVLVLDKDAGSSPDTVVNFGLARFGDSKNFDRVYCVFDRDAHADYEKAVNRCNSLRRTNAQLVVCPFIPVTSNPSFEYWVYLHFQDSSAPVVAAGDKSSGTVMLTSLRKVCALYSKADENLFEALKPRLVEAAKRARRVNALGNENPHTKIVDLVSYLAAFRKGKGIAWVEELLQ